MDEHVFFKRLKKAEGARQLRIGDIRDRVWEKVAQAEQEEEDRQYLLLLSENSDSHSFGWGVAAVLTVVATAGIIYYNMLDMMQGITLGASYYSFMGSLF